jgi:hypothetical protein
MMPKRVPSWCHFACKSWEFFCYYTVIWQMFGTLSSCKLAIVWHAIWFHGIYSTPSETINALLENLEDLEEVHILGWNRFWDIPSEIHSKIKLLDVYDGFKIPAEKMAKMTAFS